MPERRVVETIEEDELPPVIKEEARRPLELPPMRPSVAQPQSPIEIVQTDVQQDEEGDVPDPEDFTTASEPEVVFAPEPEADDAEIIPYGGVMPMYKGGDAQLMIDIGDRLQYPEEARSMRIGGRVYVSYVVNKKGEVTNVKVARGVDPFLDREAVRVVKSLTGYTAGRQGRHPVNVPFTIPIRFVLMK